jgi:hypothetical protein
MSRFKATDARYRGRRMAEERVKRLKDLTDMLLRLPESAGRDRLLVEVRSRAVDLDTGVTPRAMLPMQEPTPPPAAPKPKPPAPYRPSRVMRAPPPQPARAVAPQPFKDEPVDWPTVLMALDESQPPDAPAQGVAPWTLGLRG